MKNMTRYKMPDLGGRSISPYIFQSTCANPVPKAV
jgi:hypothetical protein